MKLLEQRRQCREGLQPEIDEEQLDKIKVELKEYTAALKMLRNRDLARRREELVQEIWEAYQDRNFSLMHRLRVQYANNGRGPPKRYDYAPQTYWDIETWQAELGERAAEGGMSCTLLDWQQNRDIDYQSHDDELLPLDAG
eukprot:7729927-Pyramimonas_sp.AAC.1